MLCVCQGGKAGSVSVDGNAYTFDDFITFEMASGWTEVPGQTGLYCREVAYSDNAQEFTVLADDQVTVKTSVTKAMMNGLNAAGATRPELTFTAYAIQKAYLTDQNGDGAVDAADAWALLNANS